MTKIKNLVVFSICSLLLVACVDTGGDNQAAAAGYTNVFSIAEDGGAEVSYTDRTDVNSDPEITALYIGADTASDGIPFFELVFDHKSADSLFGFTVSNLASTGTYTTKADMTVLYRVINTYYSLHTNEPASTAEVIITEFNPAGGVIKGDYAFTLCLPTTTTTACGPGEQKQVTGSFDVALKLNI